MNLGFGINEYEEKEDTFRSLFHQKSKIILCQDKSIVGTEVSLS